MGRERETRAHDTEGLVFRAGRGDLGAFQELYERAAPALYAWASLRLRGGPFAGMDPQDVLQETWVRGLSGLASYDSRRSFRGWLVGIAKNVVLQAYRNRLSGMPRVSEPRSSVTGSEIVVPDSVTTVGTRLGKEQALQEFLGFVESLPEENRQLVVLCGLEERTCAEAARQLGIPAETTTKRWQVLRERLEGSPTLRRIALEVVDPT